MRWASRVESATTTRWACPKAHAPRGLEDPLTNHALRMPLALVLAWASPAFAQDQAVPADAAMQPPAADVPPPETPDEEQGRPWVEPGTEPAPGTEATEQGTEIAAPSGAPTEPVRRGLGIQGSLGLSDCLGDYCGNPPDGANYEGTGLGIGGEVSGWYRPIELVGLGATLHYNLIAVDDAPFVDNSWSYFAIDLGARAYFLKRGPIDVYVGATVGWALFSASAEGDLGFSDESIKGFTLGGELGGEYFLTPQMSAGLLFRFIYPFWSEYCYDYDIDGFGADDGCEDVEDIADVSADFDESDLPTIFYIGGTFTYHLAM